MFNIRYLIENFQLKLYEMVLLERDIVKEIDRMMRTEDCSKLAFCGQCVYNDNIQAFYKRHCYIYCMCGDKSLMIFRDTNSSTIKIQEIIAMIIALTCSLDELFETLPKTLFSIIRNMYTYNTIKEKMRQVNRYISELEEQLDEEEHNESVYLIDHIKDLSKDPSKEDKPVIEVSFTANYYEDDDYS